MPQALITSLMLTPYGLFLYIAISQWDWSVLKILGGLIFILVLSRPESEVPWWSKLAFSFMAIAILAIVHEFISESFLAWLEGLLGLILLLGSASLIHFLMNPPQAAGSTLTFAFLGTVILGPLSLWFLYDATTTLGIL